MHLRVNTTRRGDTVYRYAQLVQSVRDVDGRSTTKVLKHLGALPEPVIEALKLGLRSASSGEALVLESDVACLLDGQIVANRDYLDLAVLLRCAEHWRLAKILDDLAPAGGADVALSTVILCLVLQRCVAPGSKLAAARWTPRTALPELLGFAPDTFNNTRIHRVLTDLHEITPALQERLASSYEAKSPSSALFMDVTNTHFEGMGCELSEQTRTKSEIPNKRCVGIVLLANERGYPMRWKLVGGKTKDWTAMRSLLNDLGETPWLNETVIVFDRAMGQPSTVSALKDAGLWFLTAAHRTSIDSYTTALPVDVFADVHLGGTNESYDADIKRVADTAASAAGLEEIHERLFAMDLGAVVPTGPSSTKYEPRKAPRGRPSRVSENLRLGEQAQQYQRANPRATRAMIAQALGTNAGRVTRSLRLLRLSPSVQQRIYEWGAELLVPETALTTLLDYGEDEQLEQFEALVADRLGVITAQKEALASRNPEWEMGPLRMVAYFNPRLFVDTRLRAERHCAELEIRFAEINDELANAKRSRSRDSTYRKFSRELERLGYLDAFEIDLVPLTVTSSNGTPIQSYCATLQRNAEAWARKRRHDGFVLLLAHPEVPRTARELVNHYRGKDVVEKDFETIKSVIELRPIYHYTDPKVTAHVAICMLAVLLLKTLRTFLDEGEAARTERSALESLATCRLNHRRLPTSDGSLYHPTLPDTDQEKILAALGWSDLVEPKRVRGEIKPRP